MNLSEEILIGVAGISIALIGFSGVVTALGRGGTGRWSPSEMLQLRTLVEPSIIILLAAFVPSTLMLVTDNAEIVWRAANGILFGGHCLGVGAFLYRGSNTPILISHKIMISSVFKVRYAFGSGH